MAAAIELLGVTGFLDNIEQCENQFKQTAAEKREAHSERREKSHMIRQARHRWENAMRALVTHLEDEHYDEESKTALAEMLQPLSDAEAAYRRRLGHKNKPEDQPPQ